MPTTPAEANRLLYAEIAERYDADLEPHKHDLRRAIDTGLSFAARTEAVLDACGGSGNVSLELLGRGIRPVLVDVSPEMVAIYRRRASAISPEEPVTHVVTVEQFLADDPRSWDVIFFSAALHHLDDYVAVVSLAYEHLAPGGIVVALNDPPRVGALGRRLRLVDYLASLALREPRTILRKLRERFEQRLAHRDASEPDPGYGRLAERHAISGVDEGAVIAELVRGGAEVVHRQVEYSAHFRVSERVFRALGQPTGFSLVVRRPS